MHPFCGGMGDLSPSYFLDISFTGETVHVKIRMYGGKPQ